MIQKKLSKDFFDLFYVSSYTKSNYPITLLILPYFINRLLIYCWCLEFFIYQTWCNHQYGLHLQSDRWKFIAYLFWLKNIYQTINLIVMWMWCRISHIHFGWKNIWRKLLYNIFYLTYLWITYLDNFLDKIYYTD